MAQDILGSKLPTFPSQAKQPRPGQKFYRGSFIPQRDDQKPDTGYGQNGSILPSSLNSVPASDRLSDVPANNPDPVRDALVAGKSAAVVDDQTRDLSNKADNNRAAAPVHPAMKGQQSAGDRPGDVKVGTLPAKSGAGPAAPDPKEPH
jgi:hypothetical protein